MWIPNRFIAGLIVVIALIGAGFAVSGTITPQVGGGFSFDGGITAGGRAPTPAACGGYQGPGDIAGGASIGAAIRAWSAATCGTAFASITVTGVTADMLTSSSTGLLVPQTINGSVCPNASTTLCVLTKWYDQTHSNACTGSCDFVKTATEQLGVLTTTCPLPLTACIVFPTSAATFNQVAANFTPTSPLTVSAFTNYTFGGSGSGTYVGSFGGSGGNAIIGHASTAGTATYSCDGATFPTATAADGAWFSSSLLCGTSAMQLFLNGVGQGSQALTPNLTPARPYVGGIFASGPTIYETEVGIWNSDVSGQLPALNTNQRAFYGLVIAGDSFWDSVAGSDANNCTTSGTPCQTMAKMKALNYTGGHAINWKGGSSFTGCLTLSSGNVSGTSAGSPLTIQQYSTGAAPIITSNCGAANSGANGPKTAAIAIDSVSATVNGISVRGSGLVSGSATQFGIAAQNSSGGAAPTVIVQNVDVSGFGAPGATGDAGAEVWASGFGEVAGFPASCGSVIFSLLNSTLHGATTTAFDDNGTGGSSCSSTGGFGSVVWTEQGNSIFNMGGHTGGAGGCCGSASTFPGAAAGSTIQFNLGHDNGANQANCGGPAGFWAVNAISTTMQFDEIYNMKNTGGVYPGGCDWAGFDFDIAMTNSIGQYLYSHNNVGPGYLMFNTSGNNVFRYSISENDAFYTQEDGGAAVAIVNPGGLWAVYNMTVYTNQVNTNTTPTVCLGISGGGTFTGGLWANNACFNTSTDNTGRTFMVAAFNEAGSTTLTMVNNDYFTTNSGATLVFGYQWNLTSYATLAAFQAGTSQETNSITTNPTFTTPPSGTCTWTPSSTVSWPPTGCPSAYSTLASGLKSAGANLASAQPTFFTAPYPTTAGTRDYYANTIPGTGSCFNMGAYGVCPKRRRRTDVRRRLPRGLGRAARAAIPAPVVRRGHRNYPPGAGQAGR